MAKYALDVLAREYWFVFFFMLLSSFYVIIISQWEDAVNSGEDSHDDVHGAVDEQKGNENGGAEGDTLVSSELSFFLSFHGK